MAAHTTLRPLAPAYANDPSLADDPSLAGNPDLAELRKYNREGLSAWRPAPPPCAHRDRETYYSVAKDTAVIRCRDCGWSAEIDGRTARLALAGTSSRLGYGFYGFNTP